MRSEEAREPAYTVERWKRTRFRAVLDGDGGLVCVCAYRTGARALKERLEAMPEGRADTWPA